MGSTREPPAWFSDAVARPRTAHAVDSDGIPLHVAGWNADERDKAPLLFIHGFRANTHWRDHIAPFFTWTHRVFAFDFSGMGDSPRRPVYAAGHFVDDVGAVARWLKEESPGQRLTVIGHSFGGSRLLEACAIFPGLVEHAIVLDSMFRLKSDPPLPEQALGRPEPYPDEASAIARFRLLPDQTALPYVRDHIAKHSVMAVPGGWTWRFDMKTPATFDFGAGEPVLESIRNRVDLIRGEHSEILDPIRARRIASLLRRGRGPVVIPEAFHHLMLDQPLALVTALRTLLTTATP